MTEGVAGGRAVRGGGLPSPVVGLVALVLVLVLAGCGTGRTGPIENVAAGGPLDPSTSANRAYLRHLADAGVEFGSDRAALRMGHLVCDEIGRGVSIVDAIRVPSWTGPFDEYDSGHIVAAAVAWLCSDETWR